MKPARLLRVFLSALGIAIGIAAMLRSDLSGEAARLPRESTAMIARIGPVSSASATAKLDASVYRNDHVPRGVTGSIEVLATDLDLARTVGAAVREGTWLSPATATLPGVVLGAVAAERLDLPRLGTRVWLGGVWYSVVCVLAPVPLVPELDSAALVGWGSAQSYLDFDGHPTTIYLRAAESQVEAVRSVLGRTANPAAPSQVAISRPSDTLVARRAARSAWNAPPADRSGFSSSSRRCCSPRWAAPAVRCSAWW